MPSIRSIANKCLGNIECYEPNKSAVYHTSLMSFYHATIDAFYILLTEIKTAVRNDADHEQYKFFSIVAFYIYT